MDLMKLADAISDGFEIWCLVLKLTLQMLFFLKFDRLLPSEVSDSSNELRKQVLSPGHERKLPKSVFGLRLRRLLKLLFHKTVCILASVCRLPPSASSVVEEQRKKRCSMVSTAFYPDETRVMLPTA